MRDMFDLFESNMVLFLFLSLSSVCRRRPVCRTPLRHTYERVRVNIKKNLRKLSLFYFEYG